ncbi:MAG: molybdopterin-guanine dinucleotide biosynthesis protein B [Pseudomonadota bacterium]
MKLWGVTGWKNTGKTTLMERLVNEFTARGMTVSTLKHAHHAFDIDQPGRDSHRHRMAGAHQVVVGSEARWALMTELRDAPEPGLDRLLAALDPVDLALVEGWKTAPHPKVECWRAGTAQPPRAGTDRTVRALATDATAAMTGLKLPVFELTDTDAIADFIARELRL